VEEFDRDGGGVVVKRSRNFRSVIAGLVPAIPNDLEGFACLTGMPETSPGMTE
jgi:hypothetical protein